MSEPHERLMSVAAEGFPRVMGSTKLDVIAVDDAVSFDIEDHWSYYAGATLNREQVIELHAKLGEWLEKTR